MYNEVVENVTIFVKENRPKLHSSDSLQTPNAITQMASPDGSFHNLDGMDRLLFMNHSRGFYCGDEVK